MIKKFKEYINESLITSEDVNVNPTDSNNPSFVEGSMITFSVDGGVLEIGKVKGTSRFSILSLYVNKDKRRQGRAEALLKKAIEYTNGKISGMASNDASVSLNYKLGMRAYNKELSLEEIMAQRKENPGESIPMVFHK